MRMMGMAMHVIRNDGFLALYNGLSASLCRQVSAAAPREGPAPPRPARSRAGADGLPRAAGAGWAGAQRDTLVPPLRS